MAVLLCGVAGAALVAALHGDPLANPDSRAFVALAENVRAGQGLHYQDQGVPGFELKAFRPPLYPLLLGSLLAAGLPLFAVLWLQGSLCAWTALLAAWLAGRAGGRRAAWLAGGAALLWWPAWLAAGQYMTETLYAFLLMAALALATLAVEQRRSRTSFGAGVMSGASLLARATGAATALACGVWLASRAPRLLPAFLIGLLLLWAPWAVRNRAVLGEWVWFQTSGGLNLWAGNTGRPIREGWEWMSRDLPRRGERGMDRAFRDRTQAWIRAYPGEFLGQLAAKAASFLVPRERALEYLAYRLVFPFALLGAWVAARDGRWRLALLAWLFHGAFSALSVVNLRYRLPAEYPALLLAAAGSQWVLDRFGDRRGGALCAAVVLAGAALWAGQTMLRGSS